MGYARAWFGLSPTDKLFLIWGHSHRLGSGWRGWYNGIKRAVADHTLGYYRWSAYDLSESTLRQAADALVKFQPAYVMGYAVALDRLARVNQDRRDALRRVGLKVVIATAESFPAPDSAALVGDLFNCPVAMEYGAVETGVIAHQRPDGRYAAFWRHYFLEGYPSEHVAGTYELLVTALYPRCLPLVRYRIGDLVSTDPDTDPTGFDTVIGRCNDFLILPGGAVVHSEAFTHAVKDFAAIDGYQVTQSVDGRIQLAYVAPRPLGDNAVDQIRRRLAKIDLALASISIERAQSLGKTIAGKTRRIVRAEEVESAASS